jgi:hypothetical protein
MLLSSTCVVGLGNALDGALTIIPESSKPRAGSKLALFMILSSLLWFRHHPGPVRASRLR